MVMTRDPASGDLLYGRRGGTIVRSFDALATASDWGTFSLEVRAIAASPDASRYWVALDDGMLLRSVDQRQSWQPVGQMPARARLNGLVASHHDAPLLVAWDC